MGQCQPSATASAPGTPNVTVIATDEEFANLRKLAKLSAFGCCVAAFSDSFCLLLKTNLG